MFSEFGEKAQLLLKQAEGIEAIIDNVEVTFSLNIDQSEDIRDARLSSCIRVYGDVILPLTEVLHQRIKNVDIDADINISQGFRPGFTAPSFKVFDKKNQASVTVDLSESDPKVYCIIFYASNLYNYLDFVLRINEFAGNHPEERALFLLIDHNQAPTDQGIYEELELTNCSWLWVGEGESRNDFVNGIGTSWNISENLCYLIHRGKVIWLGDVKEYTPEKELDDILEGREILFQQKKEPESEIELSKEEINEKIELVKEYLINFKQGIEDQTNLSFTFSLKITKNFRLNRKPLITTEKLIFSYVVDNKNEATTDSLCSDLLEIFPQLEISKRVYDPTVCFNCHLHSAWMEYNQGVKWCMNCLYFRHTH